MYRNKKDVDKHVENLLSKLPGKEFNSRALSFARLYFDVGDYTCCQKYTNLYLSQKDNNAAAYKLLGQASQKLGQKEKALEQFTTSLSIDPTQTNLILEICELLADEEVFIDPSRAKYWCEKAESTYPRNPITIRLRERIVSSTSSNPEDLITLLKKEISANPKDASLHARLLRHYLQNNRHKDAFDHSCNIEFGGNTFQNNYAWYETLNEILKYQSNDICDWNYQLLLLTVLERLCILSLTETPTGTSKSLIESNKLLYLYDQALEKVAQAGPPKGFPEFHSGLLQHHRGQFVFHAATHLLKRAKKDQLSWHDATILAAPLMLIAWHTAPLDVKVKWLTSAPQKQKVSVQRWYYEGSYRCSQSGHYLLTHTLEKSHAYLDEISQYCSGTHWKDKLYEKIFTNAEYLTKVESSHFMSKAFNEPILRLPRKVEVEAYDQDSQRLYPSSLHHFIWLLLNYKNFESFKCTVFDMLVPKTTNYPNCGIETLHKLDVHAFLYCAALTTQQQYINQNVYSMFYKSYKLPAHITDLLCSLTQLKWWDCAYKFSQNELGSNFTDVRTTLSRGIEVVRCVDNHGLDPELLCKLGHIFSESAKLTTNINEKHLIETRAALYYSYAIPLLEKLKKNLMVKLPEKRMFDYTHKELNFRDLNTLLEESKLYIGIKHLNENEYDDAIELLSNLKSPKASLYLCEAYKKMALEEYDVGKENNTPETKLKYSNLLLKAKSFAYKALDKLQDIHEEKENSIYTNIQKMIEEIEIQLNVIDVDVSNDNIDRRYGSDGNISSGGSDHIPISLQQNLQMSRNLSSTPKHRLFGNVTTYKSAQEPHIFDNSKIDHKSLQRIENQLKNIQIRDSSINSVIEQTKAWIDENRSLGNQINTINLNIQNTIDQFKLLKLSVDQVKDQVFECRNEYKDVGELKREVAELKKEINKLKKSSSEQTIDENELNNIDDDYKNNEASATFTPQLPFSASQTMPPFSQRIVPPFPVPPSPYQLYGQNLYNLYNQYSQFAPAHVAVSTPIFDPTRPSVNYPGVYPTPEQMYSDMMTQIVPPTLPSVPVSVVPPTSITPPTSTATTTKAVPLINKERQLPVNVVITSSDPLPTCTTAPAPILSVTIPAEHIKGTPHNYQITMPTSNESKVMPPSLFSNNIFGNSTTASTTKPLTPWMQSNTSKTTQSSNNCSPIVTSKIDYSKLSLAEASKMNTSNIFANSVSNANISNLSTTPSDVSINKSRTLSEKSNTSIENYDPCPDFKPIIPLPDEVAITTGEENETPIFKARAKLFRFVDKQWKERGLGDIKLLQHNATKKVRVLMRREQVHKICANHIITPDMDIQPMKNESKAYIWVANDYADENVVLEKFCIRFKTADIAKEFYETFEQARKDAKSNICESIQSDKIAVNKNLSQTESFMPTNEQKTILDSQTNKTTVGGFTFSSTPTFKIVNDNNVPEKNIPGTTTTKVNPFSNLSLTTTASPFSNLFASSTNQNNKDLSNIPQIDNLNKSSDVVEEFEPTIEFTPVVPLPALVDNKTGEENEIILFEHRAKLLRFDNSCKEWKERGLGNIKLLAHEKNDQKVRLLMRREQVMKVCCNHSLTKDMVFQNMPNNEKAITWCAKDFSEGALVPETFCLRFKTSQILNDFVEAVNCAQKRMKDETKSTKEQNAVKQDNVTGFGDKFKLKAGSWYCNSCYTNNLDSCSTCVCCEQPKPLNEKAGVQQKTSSITTTQSWGNQFKPKPGTWECKECFIRNEKISDYCSVCTNPRDSSMPKKETDKLSEITPKFNFGIPSHLAKVEKEEPLSWDGNFKPKPLTWECQKCYIRNEDHIQFCISCNNAKSTTSLKNEDTSIFSKPGTFNFGIPQGESAVNFQKNMNIENASIFDGTGAHKFTFGIPVKANNESQSSVNFTFGAKNDKSSGIPQETEPVNFSKKEIEEVQPKSFVSTPQTVSSTTTTFGSKGSGTFDFVFKPKTPPKLKSPKSENGDESDGNEYAPEDEGHHIHFNPVIPMPDKVDVVTGEENEDELYAHRAKLYRFFDGEWKERGRGNVKILKHKETGKLRVVMRREQVHNICLNHALTVDITYKPKDEKTWLFVVNDFSEGELILQNFCLRFANKEIALEFKEIADNARDGSIISKSKNDSDDVIFVNEIQASSEDKEKARALMLPENFFTYKNKQPCQGCRGCNDEEDDKSITFHFVTPNKQKTPITDSSSVSVYNTPFNANKTMDSPIFRTPIGILGQNTENTKNINKDIMKDFIKAEKESNSLFSNVFIAQNKEPLVQENSANVQIPVTLKTNILAPPKLSITSGAVTENVPTKSIFTSNNNNSMTSGSKSINLDTNPVFSNMTSSSTSKPMFNFSNVKTDINEKPEVMSIFGDNQQKPVNIFSGPGSIFGSLAPINQNKPGTNFFGTSISTGPSGITQDVTNEKSIFTNNLKTTDTEGMTDNSKGQEKLNDANKSINTSQVEKDSANNIQVGNNYFTSLLPNSSEINIQTKAHNFQWEGTGQKIFYSTEATNKSMDNGSGEGTTGPEEEYDPHYEPIIPLPDKITVTTGEEEEEKVFGERCKLYRYDEKTREWKERGVGELKILFHPTRKTYRLLLRREQVYKAVLNTLLFMDLELLPLKNSDRSWTWACRNYAENTAGEQETLAVRFKDVNLAFAFKNKVVECVRILQADAAHAVREKQEASGNIVRPLQLPKHFEVSSRQQAANIFNISTNKDSNKLFDESEQSSEISKQSTSKPHVHFEQTEEDNDDHDYDDEEEYDQNYAEYDEYEGYYNEEEPTQYFVCEGEVLVKQGNQQTNCSEAQIQVLVEHTQYLPKIFITDMNTGEILADMLIECVDLQMDGNSCTWTGKDYTTPVDKTVTVNFPDSDTAIQFYDACETNKTAHVEIENVP